MTIGLSALELAQLMDMGPEGVSFFHDPSKQQCTSAEFY